MYDIIYADPPWSYRDKCNDGNRGACHKYPILKLKDIKALDVGSIAEDTAMLFLWITAPLMDVGIEVIESWGFKFKTVAFTWIKITSRPIRKEGSFELPIMIDRADGGVVSGLAWGMGHYTRANPEYVLLGTRGKAASAFVKSRSIHSVIIDPAMNHSRKPDVVRKRIDRLVGPMPRKIELFARQKAMGWHSTGLDLDGIDIHEFLKREGKNV